MTENEKKSIYVLNFLKEKLYNGIYADRLDCIDYAISALREIQQYRETGKKIYEKDIVGFTDMTSTENGYSEHSCVGEVLWDEEECCFHVTDRLSAESWEVLNECKVLGNVFDNKEILDEF